MHRLIFLSMSAALLILACASEPETFDERLKAGERAFVSGDYFKARGYLLQALNEKPSDRGLLYLLGLTYSRELMYDSAAFYLGRANTLYPDDREINLGLYDAALNVEDWESARAALRVLVETGDPVESHLETLAELSLQMEDLPWAHYYYGQLLEKEPDNPDRWVQVANTAADMGSLQVAMGIVDSAVEKFGPNETFLSNKGIYHAVLKQYTESEEIFRSLILSDSTAIAYRMNLASALASQDDPQKKREALELYRMVHDVLGADVRMDSLIEVLESEIGGTN